LKKLGYAKSLWRLGNTGVKIGVLLIVFVTARAETIVIYGASGNLGSKIATEALNRGHDVIGVTRNPESMSFSHENFTATGGDVTNLESMLEVVSGKDVVILAVNGNSDDNLPENATVNLAAQTFVAAARQLGNAAPRVIHLGGGTTLYRNGVLILDTLDLVEGEYFHGVYYGQWEALEHYRAASEDVQWTVISPPPGSALQTGERTGVFRVGEDEVIVGENGEASISRDDLAVLFIDVIDDPRSIDRRITLGY